ncbi:MAG TPA: hypothetical protein VFE23_10960 [Usitatibacter sp.]|jgi:hypothetical protein|nr:hypothetical protein [Usitatibacter sp.]
MQVILIAATALHVLPAVAWAGYSFALARTAAANVERLFVPQMGAACVAVLTGGWLWSLTHAGAFATPERVLAIGALASVAALAIQAISTAPIIRRLRDDPELRRRAAVGQRIAAGLLGIAIVCMASARHV